eukprot:UN01945
MIQIQFSQITFFRKIFFMVIFIACYQNNLRPRFFGGVSILKTLGKNRLGEVVKEAFSSGVETTFLCEQITNDVTTFGLLLSQRRSQRRPKQKRIPIPPNACMNLQ